LAFLLDVDFRNSKESSSICAFLCGLGFPSDALALLLAAFPACILYTICSLPWEDPVEANCGGLEIAARQRAGVGWMNTIQACWLVMAVRFTRSGRPPDRTEADSSIHSTRGDSGERQPLLDNGSWPGDRFGPFSRVRHPHLADEAAGDKVVLDLTGSWEMEGVLPGEGVKKAVSQGAS
jgi:hypothetical protein